MIRQASPASLPSNSFFTRTGHGMDGSLTWLVRDSQGLLHRRTLPVARATMALTGLLGGPSAAQDARLIDHAMARTHVPGSAGLVFVDRPSQRVLNASLAWHLDEVPFVPDADPDLLGVLDVFDTAGWVTAVRFNARRRRLEPLAPGHDPFVRAATHRTLGTPPSSVERWDDLAIAMESVWPGVTISTDPAFGMGSSTAAVEVPVPVVGLSAMAGLLSTLRRGDIPLNPEVRTRAITGLDSDAWDLFNPVVVLNIAPWTIDTVRPLPEDTTDTWLDRVWRRLNAQGVEFTEADILAWDDAMGRNVLV